MSANKLFEKASRKAFRFASVQGALTTEDLWKLPLMADRGASLNDIAIRLDNTIERSAKKNFVTDEPKANQELIDKLEIVKYIIEYKKEQAKRINKAMETKARNQKIMQIISQKQDASLQEKSLEELQKLLEEGDTLSDD